MVKKPRGDKKVAPSAKRYILSLALGVISALLIYSPTLWKIFLLQEVSQIPLMIILMGSSVFVGVIAGYLTRSFFRGALIGMISVVLGFLLADMLIRLLSWRVLYEMGIVRARIEFWWCLFYGFFGLYGGLIGGFVGEFLIGHAKDFWTPTKLLLNGTLTPEIAAWLWILMENKLPILVCGQIDSGRTSLINALCYFAKPGGRIGIIEDDSDFKFPFGHENWLRFSTKDSLKANGKLIPKDKLLEQVLRQNVDYVVVNEVKSKRDVSTWINAVSLGHGGVAGFDASTFYDLIMKLQQLGVESESLLAISGGIIFTSRYKGKKGMVRKISELVQVNKNGDITSEPLVTYDVQNHLYILDTTRLLSSISMIRISEKAERAIGELFENRASYLKWLMGYAKSKRDILKPDGFFSEISRYYADQDYYRRILNS